MDLLKVNQAARILGCSEAFLRRAELRGKIPKARRDINHWRVYDNKDIERLMELLLPTSTDSSLDGNEGGKNDR